MKKILDKIKVFDENTLPSLDEILLGSLELFEKQGVEKLDISGFNKPLIAGSGNAIVTAKIIFSGINAIFCDETNFDEYINMDIDGLIIVSASGEKHASIFANKALDKGISTKLITCNNDSSTKKLLGDNNTVVTSKITEPYTYNTSTYLGWVLSCTGEKSSDILKYINSEINPVLDNIDFGKYRGYILVTPDKYSGVNQLFDVKFKELFGRIISRDICSYEQLKHAVTVIDYDKELLISFGNGDFFYEGNQINFPLPDNCKLGTMMAIGYYIIGKIQNSHPQYFKENIGKYIENMNKTSFGKCLKVIVK